MKSEVLTDSPAGLQNLPAAAPGPCRGSAFPDGLPALRAALALLREGEGGDPSPRSSKAEALSSRGSASGQRAHQRDHRQWGGPAPPSPVICVRSLRTEKDATAPVVPLSNSHRLSVSETASLPRKFLLNGSYQGP